MLLCAGEKKNKLGVLIFSGNKTTKNTGTLLIQNLALSHNKPEFLKE
jgi:hypothetical protein